MTITEDASDTSPGKGEVGAQRRVGVTGRFDRTPTKTARARRLRSEMTDAERRLWAKLRGRQLEGVEFRRQHSIGPYVLDFYCGRLGLVIEADGGQHADSARDVVRDAWLASRGLRVLRFWNNDILRNTDGVLETVRAAILNLAAVDPHPASPFQGEGAQAEATDVR